MQVNGYYTVRVLNADGTCKHSHSGKNIITNRGRSNVFNGNFGDKIKIGTGRAAEALPTTSLGNELVDYTLTGTWSSKYISSINVERNTVSSSAVLVGRTAVFQSNQIISELGIVNNADELNTYSLLRDIAGILTTVTVNAGEILEIEYEVVLTCVFVEAMEASSGFKQVITYRLPAIYSIGLSSTVPNVTILKSDFDGANNGTVPVDVQVSNVGSTRKNGSTITAFIPANVTAYTGEAYGFLINNVNGFTVGLFFTDSFVLDTLKEYTAKAVFDL